MDLQPYSAQQITQIIFGEECKSWSFSLCNFLQLPAAFLLPNSFRLCSAFMRDYMLHSHKDHCLDQEISDPTDLDTRQKAYCSADKITGFWDGMPYGLVYRYCDV
jgi:hypothetical protein